MGHEFSLSGSIALFGAMTASMEKAVLEGPVFGEIHPKGAFQHLLDRHLIILTSKVSPSLILFFR